MVICQNCKKPECLDGEAITRTNFVNGALVRFRDTIGYNPDEGILG